MLVIANILFNESHIQSTHFIKIVSVAGYNPSVIGLSFLFASSISSPVSYPNLFICLNAFLKIRIHKIIPVSSCRFIKKLNN